jgi:hypothetical protein
VSRVKLVPRSDRKIDHRDAPAPGYEPVRPPRLRADATPPPLPPRCDNDGEGFGSADEDGLRMIAALETLTSLEPDYADDLPAEEAAVTIIDAIDEDAVAEALGTGDASPPRTLWQGDGSGPTLLLNGYETFTGMGEEASVEIVEVGPTFDAEPAPEARPAQQPASLAERIAAAGRGRRGRFFKALSGD